jgi:hypothetical protein
MANRRDVFKAVAALPAASLATAPFARALAAAQALPLDRGMHVVYRGEHGLVENGRIQHRFAGPAALVEQLSPSAAAARDAR